MSLSPDGRVIKEAFLRPSPVLGDRSCVLPPGGNLWKENTMNNTMTAACYVCSQARDSVKTSYSILFVT